MQDTTKTTLSTLLSAESTQVNPLIANSTDENIDFGDAAQTLTPPRIGTYWPSQGGMYAGVIFDQLRHWHLILPITSDALIEDAEWSQMGVEIPGEFSTRDGLHNTKLILAADPTNKIALHCTSLNIEGHNDFYWPSQFEQNLCCINLQGHFKKDWHWSSTQYSADNAWTQAFEYGFQNVDGKNCRYAARAVRRILIIE
ncbi:DUF1566 domain-containing protein [Cellvibrio sp. KY-GH-1]|uniref:DUF1566 domain-containing protein n=1 Tax=Cellvibrio sp. KY-GH-1 TaxID=2303332 RepID=UPI001244407B|nr:DUF1566 domain-containing protein [Cellvibrio sp. KY-GH-1]QEY15491.1 DUF1566 domain-containing protein [Cellvibrio sp. KY-GH-1]